MSFDTPPRIYINVDYTFQIIEAYNYLMIYDECNNEFIETYEFQSIEDMEADKDWWWDFIFGYGEYA